MEPVEIPEYLISAVQAETTKEALEEIAKCDCLEGQFLELLAFVAGLNDRIAGFTEVKADTS